MDDLLTRTLGHTVEVCADLRAGEARANADPNQLELAILNLAINARDAMGEGGTITVSSRIADDWHEGLQPGRHVVVAVSDTGHGIPAERPRPGEIPSAETPLSHGERVLVVDDDAGVRRFIVQCLKSLGYAVTEASGGQAGLDRIAGDRPDLMVVDFAMPGINGAQVAVQARQLMPNLAVLLVTGYADAQAIKDLVKSEAVLRKPFKVSDLALAVRRTLEEQDSLPA